LSLRLQTSDGGAPVGTALAAALAVTLAALMLALSPAVAEAQTEDKSIPSVVVRPGDSLWSISEERLGQNATPQRIADAAEQIYTLNRGRIGADPDLIFVGQELLVPPAMASRRSTGATPVVATTARKTSDVTEADPRNRVAEGETGKAPRTAPGGADAKDGKASAPVDQRGAEPVSLPDEAEAAPTPSVRTLASNDSPPSPVAPVLRSVRSAVASAASVVAAVSGSFADSFAEARADGRRLLGFGVLLLTLVVVTLMAWKLPMSRPTREDAERWRIPIGYRYEMPAANRNNAPFASRPDSTGGFLGDRGDLAVSIVRKADMAGGRRRTVKARAVPRSGLALGAHNPEVRRALLRTRVPVRARNPRPRGGTSFGLGTRP
jgi:nucleoid-associated protein YgaU